MTSGYEEVYRRLALPPAARVRAEDAAPRLSGSQPLP